MVTDYWRNGVKLRHERNTQIYFEKIVKRLWFGSNLGSPNQSRLRAFLSPMPDSDVDFNNPAEVAALVRRTNKTPVRLGIPKTNMSPEAYDYLDKVMENLEEMVYAYAENIAWINDRTSDIEVKHVEEAQKMIRHALEAEARL